MNKPISKIDVFELTVEEGGIFYNMEDLLRLSEIYERFSTAEYLYENQSMDKPLTREEAYNFAKCNEEE